MTSERVKELKTYVSAAAYAIEGAIRHGDGDLRQAEKDYHDTINALDMLIKHLEKTENESKLNAINYIDKIKDKHTPSEIYDIKNMWEGRK